MTRDESAQPAPYRLRALCEGKPHVIDDVMFELTSDLATLVLSHTHEQSLASHNVGGWRSSDKFFDWPDPAIQTFVATLSRDFLLGCKASGWAMVNRHGSHHARHNHGGCGVLSGVFYVDPGGGSSPGTVFEIPQIEQPAVDLEVPAKRGRLVLFPSGMWHRVPIYYGSKPRITIAFNVYI